MTELRAVEIRESKCLLDDVLKVNELFVSHRRSNRSMSAEQRRLVLEHGDSAAVLLFNRDTRSVVLANQFRPATLGKGDGWITGTPVTIIGQNETSSAAAVRAAAAQTGYNIREPKHIVTFFPSPAVISERTFLYYAEVGHNDKLERGSDGEGEDIEVREIPLDDFLEQVKSKYVEDPKAMIGGLWLQEELKSQARRPLDHSTVKYSLVKHPDLFVGYKTGPIADVKDVSIWVNSENEDMIMDRFIGRTISANIRYLGADRDQADNVTEDIINEELISAVGPRGPCESGL